MQVKDLHLLCVIGRHELVIFREDYLSILVSSDREAELRRGLTERGLTRHAHEEALVPSTAVEDVDVDLTSYQASLLRIFWH